MPQFVIRADDPTSRHESYRNVGNVAFQPDQPLGSLEAFLVEAVPATTLTHNGVTQNPTTSTNNQKNPPYATNMCNSGLTSHSQNDLTAH